MCIRTHTHTHTLDFSLNNLGLFHSAFLVFHLSTRMGTYSKMPQQKTIVEIPNSVVPQRMCLCVYPHTKDIYYMYYTQK